MKKQIDNYIITSNLKRVPTVSFDNLSKKYQDIVLKEYSHVYELETSYFVWCCGEYLPTDEITNFTINTIPDNIRKYFYGLIPNHYFGVAPYGVYLSGSWIFAISEFQDEYIKFRII